MLEPLKIQVLFSQLQILIDADSKALGIQCYDKYSPLLALRRGYNLGPPAQEPSLPTPSPSPSTTNTRCFQYLQFYGEVRLFLQRSLTGPFTA